MRELFCFSQSRASLNYSPHLCAQEDFLWLPNAWYHRSSIKYMVTSLIKTLQTELEDNYRKWTYKWFRDNWPVIHWDEDPFLWWKSNGIRCFHRCQGWPKSTWSNKMIKLLIHCFGHLIVRDVPLSKFLLTFVLFFFFFLSFQRTFTVIVEAWDWDNTTRNSKCKRHDTYRRRNFNNLLAVLKNLLENF